MASMSFSVGDCTAGDQVEVVKKVVIGNLAYSFGQKRAEDGHTHQWTVYIKPYLNEDMSAWIRKIHFRLHDSYANRDRIVTKPPYEVTETGWGEFEVAIKVYFQGAKPGQDKPVTFHHLLRLFPHLYSVEVNLNNRRSICTESYDEIVFTRPSSLLKELLATTRPVTHAPYHHHVDFEQKERDSLASIDAVRRIIQSDLAAARSRAIEYLTTMKESESLLGQEEESTPSAATTAAMVDNNPGFTFPPAVCRLCGETTESPLPFFADGRDSLASSCLRFLPASVTKGWNIFDKLPKSVCHRCIQKVEEVRQFLQQITDVQERFKASLRENGISPDMDPADCPQMKVETCEDNLNGLDADSMDMGSAPYCEVKLSFPDETEEGTEDHVLTTPSVPRAARRGRRKGTVPRKLDSADKDDIGDGELDDSCGPQSETENAMSDTTSDAKPKSPGSIPCNNCDTTVRNFTELNRHYELSHAELTGASIKAKCPQCKKGVESSKWKEHKKSHRNRKRVMDACIYCGKLRPRKQMKRHLLIHTGTKTFHCGSCSRSFFLAVSGLQKTAVGEIEDMPDESASMASPSQFMSPMSSVGGVSEDGGPSGHPHHPHHHPHPGGMSMSSSGSNSVCCRLSRFEWAEMVFLTTTLFNQLRKGLRPDKFWKRRHVFRFSQAYYGRAWNVYSIAQACLLRSLQKDTVGRRIRSAQLRYLDEGRIQAATREHGMEVHDFREGLGRSHIVLGTRMLQTLAIQEPRTFQSLVALSRERLKEEGMLPKDQERDPDPDGNTVITRGLLGS
ncbi:unnamed protein product [Cyprideis torosa]|uniref:Uncharacterized protein n=1 Tax=Cyprideis torosa TaxID=163714 RepID=A0A7R8W745_9CRUS|nr:unnamed protein product [Cyprideis torosa]CAG0882926.1 unnamed protein product [Cyprideis torosa]